MSLSTSKNNLLHRFDGILWGNPVLALGLGVPFAVISTVSMKSAAVLSAAMVCTSVPVFLLSSLCARYIPQWLRGLAYAFVAALALIPLRALLFAASPAVFDTLGVYYALMALNPAVIIPALSNRVSGEKPVFALLRAACYSVGFALVLFGIALVREPLGSGTLWGHPVEAPFQLSPVQYPFFGFILLGYFAALYQMLANLFRFLAQKSGNSPKKPKNSKGGGQEEKLPLFHFRHKEDKENLDSSNGPSSGQRDGKIGYNDVDGMSKNQLSKGQVGQ